MRRRDRSEYISELEVKRLLMDSEANADVQRLVIALEYVNGADVSQLSEQYGIERNTIQYWLDRFAYDTPSNALAE